MGGKGGLGQELEVETPSAPPNKHKAKPKVEPEFRLLLPDQRP